MGELLALCSSEQLSAVLAAVSEAAGAAVKEATMRPLLGPVATSASEAGSMWGAGVLGTMVSMCSLQQVRALLSIAAAAAQAGAESELTQWWYWMHQLLQHAEEKGWQVQPPALSAALAAAMSATTKLTSTRRALGRSRRACSRCSAAETRCPGAAGRFSAGR